MHHNQTELHSTPDFAHAFAKSFQFNNSNANYEDNFLIYKNESKKKIITINPYPQPDNAEFNIKELYLALQNCNSKSPGPDDIPFTFLKNLSDNAINKLVAIYNLIWNLPQPMDTCTRKLYIKTRKK